jgi:hypothetical protein
MSDEAWMAGAVNTIGQSKRGGGDRSSRPAQLQATPPYRWALAVLPPCSTQDFSGLPDRRRLFGF